MTKVKDSKGQEFKFYDVVKDDYPELEGKIIKYNTGAWVHSCLVVGCNRSVGLTLVSAQDKDMYLMCIRGPVCSEPTDFSKLKCTYDELFNVTVEMIQKGSVKGETLVYMLTNTFEHGTCDGNCAYKQ